MLKFTQKIFKAIYTGRIIYIIMICISIPLMRRNKLSLSLRLIKHTQKERTVEIYPYQSVYSWVSKHGVMQKIYDKRSFTIYSVDKIGHQSQQKDIHADSHTVTLPTVSINVLKQADIVGGSEILFTKDGTVLYDELAKGDVNRYGVKAYGIVPHNYFRPYLPSATDNYLQCLFQYPTSSIRVDCAISLLKDHSQNYYHWLLECLPRAILSLNQLDLSDSPFLIDEGLPAQLVQSLKLLAPARELIEIPRGRRVYVEKLFFPSILSPTHDYYGNSPRADDFLIAPEAVMLLREAFLAHVITDDVELNWDYIYVARSGGSHRAVTNEADVIKLVESMGFKVVYPGNLSFVEQITLFSNAKIIIGPTGAGMANIIFAKKDCKIAVLAAATINANYYLFAQLSQYIGQVITYVCGKPAHAYQLQSDYKIDVSVLRSLIIKYIAETNAVNIDADLKREF